MNILLVRPKGPKLYETSGPDIGLGYLMRVLGDRGHKVGLYDFFQKGTDLAGLVALVADFEPGLIGFKTYTFALGEVEDLMNRIRQSGYGGDFILGGPHPSGDPAGTLEKLTEASFVFAGEAETGLPELVSALEAGSPPAKILGKIPGLAWRVKGAIKANDPVFPEDFDRFGLPDWDAMNPYNYPIDYTGAVYVPIMTTRGCPFHCTYCAGYRVTGRRMRHRPIENILSEIRFVRDRWGVSNFSLVDDNFTLDKEFAKEVCRAIIAENLAIRWRCPNGVRLDSLDEELIRLMERAGCFFLYVALESGSQRVIDAMNRSTKLEVMIEKVRMIRRVSVIKMLGFFIIGYPDETREDILASIRLACDLPLDMASFFLFTPHPGTQVYKRLVAEGRIEETDWSSFFYDKVSLRPDGLTEKELLKLEKYAYRTFYLRPRIIKGILEDVKSPGQFGRLLKRSLSTALNI